MGIGAEVGSHFFCLSDQHNWSWMYLIFVLGFHFFCLGSIIIKISRIFEALRRLTLVSGVGSGFYPKLLLNSQEGAFGQYLHKYKL